MVTAYIPTAVWVISAVICSVIAAKRQIKFKPILLWELMVLFLGSFAIPLMFLPKSNVADAKTNL